MSSAIYGFDESPFVSKDIDNLWREAYNYLVQVLMLWRVTIHEPQLRDVEELVITASIYLGMFGWTKCYGIFIWLPKITALALHTCIGSTHSKS